MRVFVAVGVGVGVGVRVGVAVPTNAILINCRFDLGIMIVIEIMQTIKIPVFPQKRYFGKRYTPLPPSIIGGVLVKVTYRHINKTVTRIRKLLIVIPR